MSAGCTRAYLIRVTSFFLHTSDDSAVLRGAPGSMVSQSLVYERKENAGGLQEGAWGNLKMRAV